MLGSWKPSFSVLFYSSSPTSPLFNQKKFSSIPLSLKTASLKESCCRSLVTLSGSHWIHQPSIPSLLELLGQPQPTTLLLSRELCWWLKIFSKQEYQSILSALWWLQEHVWTTLQVPTINSMESVAQIYIFMSCMWLILVWLMEPQEPLACIKIFQEEPILIQLYK